jgi:hypothetical protein
MGSIIRAEDLPEETELYLKKDAFGYRIVHPIKDKDGKIVWINLLVGGWRNFFFLVICITLLLWTIYDTHQSVQGIELFYKNISQNPSAYCQQFISNFNYTLP